ncbi:MAG: hypothetical protein COW30_16370 [Rhodospirillales bacterium CG15_BIG_FIL_POST_REV_8_21_14_020_66_15]|nr:MAG: hypothetical protein COW30_16370 [Rhodospirillales bacterium CG15_BIG_FIL_POST_REV_8_21_14_020_66_15]
MPRKGRFKNFDETVRRFIVRYGEDALAEAQRRVHELEAAGDAEGADTWRRVAAAIAISLADPGTGQLH